VLGVVNTVLPFALITWGETHIESGLASVLQGTAALFTALMAHFAFRDERFTLQKIAGLVLGFLGVVVLAGRSANSATPEDATLHLLGQLAIVAASLSYAVGGTYSRQAIQNRLEPLMASAGAMTVAAIITGFITYAGPLVGGPSPATFAQLAPRTLGAILALGLVNTFGAYLIFYPLVAVLGAARTSMVTYVIPVIGLALGVIWLGERLDARLIVGAVMILASIGVVNLKGGSAWLRQRMARLRASGE
jgi:drug/metabolite transporter (DMT)-like permease